MLWLWPPFPGKKVRHGVWAWSSESPGDQGRRWPWSQVSSLQPALAVLGWPTHRQRQSMKYQGSQRGMYLWGEQSESEMSLCLQTVLLDERSCLHIKKGCFVFRWRVFISVLEVYPGEATYHCLSSTASPVGKGGWHPFVAVLCAEGPW